MGDVQCIFDNKLVNEKKDLKKDLFSGPSFDIIILLLKGEKTASEISRELNINLIATNLYLSRLLIEDIIFESDIINNDNTIQKIYKLSTSKLDIINNQYMDNLKERDTTINYMCNLTQNAVLNVYKHPKKPYLIKSCFINIQKEKVDMFKEKLQSLIKEFEDNEDNNCNNTYCMSVTYTPYDIKIK